MKVESVLYNKFNDYVQCNICNHRCIIKEGKTGFCGLRENIRGNLIFNNYGIVSSLNVDPIEKKPLYHFLPSSRTYSIGGFSCNMSCLFCQNYMISQQTYNKNNAIELSPETIVENAIYYNCRSIAYTYNEPTVSIEFIHDIARLAHKKNLKNVYISNGYMTDEGLEYILPYIDGFNIDLKFITEKLYSKIAHANLGYVLENLKEIYNSNAHLEITNLLLDNINDSDDMIINLLNFIGNELSKDVPIHFSRAFPYFRMTDLNVTDESRMIEAYNIAKDMGFKYVYLGNIDFDNNTYCPNCGELLIKRNNYSTCNLENIKNGKCRNCSYKINIVNE